MTHPTRAIAPVILRDYLSIRPAPKLTNTSVQESHETGRRSGVYRYISHVSPYFKLYECI